MSDNKDYFIKGQMYQYDLGWLIEKLLSFEKDLATAIDLKTIKYADPIQWDITTQYAANTVVIDPKTGTAYMSKVPVPAGVTLDNTNYWVVIFNYQDIYYKIMDGVAFNDRDEDYATKDLLVNDLVWYTGDLYRVTRAIPTGSKYIPGTNLVKTTIESLLSSYYGRDRVAQVNNDTVNVSGDYTLNAGDIAETSDNRTIKVTKDRETDVDGSDSVHIDGASTLNVGGLRTEAYAGDKAEKVAGTYTGKFGSASFETEAPNWLVKFPDKTADLHDIGDITAVKTIFDFGAKGDGVTDDSDAFMSAASSNDVVLIPPRTYYCTEAVSGATSNAVFVIDSAVIFNNVVPIEGGTKNARVVYASTADSATPYQNQIVGLYEMTGGTRGNVQTPNYTHALIRGDTKNFVWGALTIVDIANNIVNDSENVGIYSQINSPADSDTGMWGACIELRDKKAAPKASKIGLEITYGIAENDVNGSRNVIHAALYPESGATGGQINSVLLVSGENVSGPKVSANSLIMLEGVNYNTLISGTQRDGKQTAHCSIGIDFSNIEVENSAIKLETKKLQYNTLNTYENNSEFVISGEQHALGITPTLTDVTTKTLTGRFIPVTIDGTQFFLPLYQ